MGEGHQPMTALLGQWGQDEPGEAWLNFVEDGSVHGSDGCNRIMGKYQFSASRVDFGMLASTMMYCPDVEAWLGAASYGVLGERLLELFDANDSKIGSLTRFSHKYNLLAGPAGIDT